MFVSLMQHAHHSCPAPALLARYALPRQCLLQAYCQRGEHGGFLPAVKQIANVAALPGIVKVIARGGREYGRSKPERGHCVQPLRPALHRLLLNISSCPLRTRFSHCLPQKSIALPDVHSGYGFAIGEGERLGERWACMRAIRWSPAGHAAGLAGLLALLP
mgnify:CR=1 FL=1